MALKKKRARGRPPKLFKRRSIRELKKARFLSMYDLWCGNVPQAAAHAHTSNKSFYNWLRTDLAFAQKIADLNYRWEMERLADVELPPPPRWYSPGLGYTLPTKAKLSLLCKKQAENKAAYFLSFYENNQVG